MIICGSITSGIIVVLNLIAEAMSSNVTYSNLTHLAGGIYPWRTVDSADPALTRIGGHNSSAVSNADGSYVYFTSYSTHTVRRLNTATKEIDTIFGKNFDYAYTNATTSGTTSAALVHPMEITFDAARNALYVHSYYCIRKLDLTQNPVVGTTLAGNCGVGGSADGSLTSARFQYIPYFYLDGDVIWVSDVANYTIRKIDLIANTVTTIAGSPGVAGHVNGIGANARFDSAQRLTRLGDYLYVTNWASTSASIRRINLVDGLYTVSDYASVPATYGHQDGAVATSRFYYTNGITNDGTHLYVADYYNHAIRKINVNTNIVSTLYQDTSGFALYGLNYANGKLYSGNMSLGQINSVDTTTGARTVLGGTPNAATWNNHYTGMVNGSGNTARFSDPRRLVQYGDKLIISDFGNNRLRRYDLNTGVVDTLTGNGGTGCFSSATGSAATIYAPLDMVRVEKYIYVTGFYHHAIFRVNADTGQTDLFAGVCGDRATAAQSASKFYHPFSITTDYEYLYVSNYSGREIHKVRLDNREMSYVAGTFETDGPYALTDDISTSTFRYDTLLGHTGDSLITRHYEWNYLNAINMATGAITKFTNSVWYYGWYGMKLRNQSVFFGYAHNPIVRYNLANQTSATILTPTSPNGHCELDTAGSLLTNSACLSGTREVLAIGDALYLIGINGQNLWKAE